MSDDENPRESSNINFERTPTAPDENAAFAAFDLFKVYLDKKLNSLKEDIADSSEVKNELILKKLKADSSHKFKYTGNKMQFEFNQEIQSEIDRIERAADKKDFSTIKDVCVSLGKCLNKRNKCIKLADKSPGGWDTVKEYLSDELASDSEDEKRIRCAENRALHAQKQRKDKFKRKREVTPSRDFRDVRATTSAAANLRGFRRITVRPTDICFGCNQTGHWRKDCPRIKDINSKQQSQ
ncbi:hypothetical protein FSP39_001087 [Pinctada imbricata]|uniref:CCHC-type domain-containing protein n=1 Tax=Pinctada imbricata TaxID=66713 RepID=A0AA89BHJ0_PINIB|nr:hypothetical protein FSP39_001087 [Pinctada imbricata]